MKKLLFLLVATFTIVVSVNSQRVYTLANDTITDGATTYTVAVSSTSSSGSLVLQAAFTQLSGTTAATANIQGSADGVNYSDLVDIAEVLKVIPNDTVTVVNGTVCQAIITNSPFRYYRWKIVHTGTQSTKIVQAYLPKLK